MKFCFTALMLASASLASAQITITQAHLPKAKDPLRNSTASAAGVDPEPANRGANRTWDFSSLTATGQDIYKYVAANTTP